MGTFGHKIFEDDFAQEVREMFLEKILDGCSTEKATEEVLNENMYALSDSDERTVLWISLAATQWEYGRLLEHVQKKALQIIDSEEDLKKWSFDKKREKVLQALRTKLVSEQPKEKKVTKKKVILNEGDVFQFKINPETFVYGRVLTDNYFLFYRFKSADKNIPLEKILDNKTAFIAWCTEEGFLSRKWKVIGNVPLEPALKEPVYFYHQAVADPYCRVFNIWERDIYWDDIKKVHEDECKHLEQAGCHSPVHIIKRLEKIVD